MTKDRKTIRDLSEDLLSLLGVMKPSTSSVANLKEAVRHVEYTVEHFRNFFSTSQDIGLVDLLKKNVKAIQDADMESENLLKLIGIKSVKAVIPDMRRAIATINDMLRRHEFPQGTTLLHAFNHMSLEEDKANAAAGMSMQLMELLGLQSTGPDLTTQKRLDEVLFRLQSITDKLQTTLHYDQSIPLLSILGDVLSIGALHTRAPIPMLLVCHECCQRHIDTGEFATKPHHTHACQHCGMTWRPAIGPTVGVQFLPGFKNEDA